jgi:hypothetical protein
LQRLLDSAVPEMSAFLAACTPGYYNGEGATARGPAMARFVSFQGGTMPFLEILHDWRAGGDLQGLELG